MFNMGPVRGLHYCIAPETEQGFEVYSECYRDYKNGNGFQTYRNSCGFFSSKEEAQSAIEKMQRLT